MLADLIPKLAAMDQAEDHAYYPRPSLASPATPDDPGRCVRAMVYHRLGVRPAPWPGRFLLVLDDSSWHEELTLDWLAKSAHTIHSRQMPVDLALPRPIGPGGYCHFCKRPIANTLLHGHIDALFTDLVQRCRLLEHKAVSMYAFDDMLAGTPSLDHLTQGCIYMAALQRVHPDLGECVLLVKNKNSSAYLEFRFTYHADSDRCHVFEMTASEGIHRALDLTFDGLLARALEKFEAVESYAASHTLPVRPYRMDSWRCLTGDTMVKTYDGWKPIESITTSDRVFALDGAYHQVVNTHTNHPQKPIIELKPYLLSPIRVTADHLILVEPRHQKHWLVRPCPTRQATWVPAADILANPKGYRLLYKVDTRVDPTLTFNIHELNLLGLFITEGNLRNKQRGNYYSIDFTFHEKERHLVELIRRAARKLFNRKVRQYIWTDPRNGRRTLRVAIYSREVVRFLEKHINIAHAHQKSFKEHVLLLSPALQLKLLKTMIRGDGCHLLTRNSPTEVYSTASNVLSLQVQQFYFRNNIIAGIVFNRPNSKSFPGSKGCFHVRNYYAHDTKHHVAYFQDGFVKVPIHKARYAPSPELVYDLTVHEAHNYLTSAGIVHNCGYCRFQRMCWDGYPAEVNARNAIATLDPAVAPLLAQYAEAATTKRLNEITIKRLRPEILAALEAHHVKTGVANGYHATVSIQARTTLDESLLPDDIKQAAQVTKSIEILRVTPSKENNHMNLNQGA